MCFESKSKNRGQELEEKIYDILKTIGFKRIKKEKELISLFGFNASSIDFLVESDQGIIAIQTKWKGSKRRETKDINNFVKSLDYLTNIFKEEYKKDLLFGLWISRLEPFEDNKRKLEENKTYAISCFESIEDLGYKTLEWISNIIIYQ